MRYKLHYIDAFNYINETKIKHQIKHAELHVRIDALI